MRVSPALDTAQATSNAHKPRRPGKQRSVVPEPHTGDEWDERVSCLRKELAEAESCWRESLIRERGARGGF
jgi:hypothetical protein